MKKVLSAVLTAALLVSTVPAAFAASDIDGHWAKSYITELHENGIINPSASTGNYGPDDKVTRWEFMRYINRAFGFTEKADISFSDVNSSDVFYETVQIAVKQGYINGVGNNRMAPEGTLTREQAATILGRLHKYTPTADLSALDMFSDRAKLSDYSKSYVAEAVKQGYINGYTNGTFKPQGTLSRGELAKMLYEVIEPLTNALILAGYAQERYQKRYDFRTVHVGRCGYQGQSVHHRGRSGRQCNA